MTRWWGESFSLVLPGEVSANERTGTEDDIRFLTENYDKDPRIMRIVDTTDIFLVPSVNPDGFEMESRYNTNEEDLNRAFPGWRDMGLPR